MSDALRVDWFERDPGGSTTNVAPAEMMNEICADLPHNSVSRMSGRVEIKTAGRTADHWCCCVLTPGHMEVIPQAGHGCPCGAIWGKDQQTIEES